ncbi:hypothetical protein [Aureispira anguillae]|uniref:GIY-YIG domain-containing protein n=1 Tax=Aureispira anguillae TaxID=2864201 RepID=A0A916DU47_9BACT|nr:hypothetical protein [Aureispira anguillae]BDS13026.1 hypothetical protein AsAng_0037540 [Aureispira anguillae]
MNEPLRIIETNTITVHEPIEQEQLGRFRAIAGIFLIRKKGKKEVLYIGRSINLYCTIMRLFQSQGKLVQESNKDFSFEILTSSHIYMSTMTYIYLRNFFQPQLNTNYKPRKLSKVEKKQRKRILNAYQEQSVFDKVGEHKSDS